MGTQARAAMTTPEAQVPCVGMAHCVASGTFQVRGNTVLVQSYCCLLLCTKMGLILCINPAGRGLCVLSLQADEWRLRSNKTCVWMLGA